MSIVLKTGVVYCSPIGQLSYLGEILVLWSLLKLPHGI